MSNASKKVSLLIIMALVFAGLIVNNTPTLKGRSSAYEPEIIQVSSNLSAVEAKTVSKSSNSAVRLLSRASYGMIASSTGTLISHKDSYYVLSTSHGVVGGCDNTVIIVSKAEILPCQEVVVNDVVADYSIIRIARPLTAEPVELNSILPRDRQWKRLLSLQNKIFYTGFPNSAGPLTISGRIVGFSESFYMFVHSYAWSGSSGSGVFSYDGKLIGIVVALDIGETPYGVDVLEDMVLVLPANLIEWERITGE